jgi:O-antigen/teichoic acid export membrane protein
MKFFRLTPFDCSTEEGRSNERYRLALYAVCANFASRGISMLVMVMTVSLTVPYLGSERFGVWMTISSLAGMLTFMDLGVGNALTNRVAQAATNPDKCDLVKVVSGGVGFLFILAVFLVIVLSLLNLVIPWDRLIKVTSYKVQSEMQTAIRLFVVLFSLTILTTGIQRIFHGMQRGFEVHLFSVVGSMFSLIALSIAARTHAEIATLLACTMGGQIVSNIVLGTLLFRRGQLSFSGIVLNIRSESPNLVRVGGLFLLLQIGTMVGWGADSLIISSTLGASAVAMFSLTQRLFQFASQPLAMLNAPMWPAFADAHSRGEKKFIRTTLEKALLVNLIVGSLVSLTILVFGEYFVGIWAKGVVVIPFSLLAIYAVWSIFDVVTGAFATFMNGCNIVKPQVYGVLALITISLPLKLFLISRYGIVQMLVGFVTFFVLNIAFWYGIVFRRDIRKILF